MPTLLRYVTAATYLSARHSRYLLLPALFSPLNRPVCRRGLVGGGPGDFSPKNPVHFLERAYRYTTALWTEVRGPRDATVGRPIRHKEKDCSAEERRHDHEGMPKSRSTTIRRPSARRDGSRFDGSNFGFFFFCLCMRFICVLVCRPRIPTYLFVASTLSRVARPGCSLVGGCVAGPRTLTRRASP